MAAITDLTANNESASGYAFLQKVEKCRLHKWIIMSSKQQLITISHNQIYILKPSKKHVTNTFLWQKHTFKQLKNMLLSSIFKENPSDPCK